MLGMYMNYVHKNSARFFTALCFILLEWTHALTKFLKDQLNKIADFYQGHFAGITSSQHQQRMTPEMEQALKQWNYIVRLSHWLYEVRSSTNNTYTVFT